MSTQFRLMTNRLFTISSGSAVVLMALALAIILFPMLGKGMRAVFFQGTVEFRHMQLNEFERGNQDQIEEELKQVQTARDELYQMIADFRDSQGPSQEQMDERADQIYDDYKDHIDPLPYAKRRILRKQARDMKNKLIAAMDPGIAERSQALELLDAILAEQDNPDFAGTPAEAFFTEARQLKSLVQETDIGNRTYFLEELLAVEQGLRKLFGPLPGEEMPTQAMNKYGATRWDMAQEALETVLWKENWVQVDPDEPLVNRPLPRREIFAGTVMEPFFDKVQQDLPAMLHPRFTVYWQYFIDDNIDQYYFGGVGPEILGTLMLTLLSMLFAVPLGVISAAYLVECAGDNFVIRIIRMCINSLAGVPSIVFGLFGLAFFVSFFMPRIGHDPSACVLTASLTLAILALPVIIRASEEAIRAVPPSYKEASLALGAGKFRTFVTVTLPAALPGILTGIILSLSRAAGETAPILLAGAVTSGPVPTNIFQPTRALSTGAFDIAVGSANAPSVPHQQYGMVTTLILLVLLLNILAIIIRSKTAQKLRGY